MPVIVVGADTEVGSAILDALVEPDREVRAFVTDPDLAVTLRGRGVKVAVGDVSDDSHVQAASLHVFTAVLVGAAARDQRERSFADSAERVLQGWASAVAAAHVSRIIWVHDGPVPEVRGPEVAVVAPDHPRLAEEVKALDEARSLG